MIVLHLAASFTKGASDIKNIAVALVVALVLFALGKAIASERHRAAWAAVPLVAIIFVIADSGSRTVLRDAVVGVINLFRGIGS